MMGNEHASSRGGDEKVSPGEDEKQSGGAPRRRGSRKALTPRRHVASAEGIGEKEPLEIGAGESGDLPTSAVEVGANGIFFGDFFRSQMDITRLLADLGGRDAQDDWHGRIEVS